MPQVNRLQFVDAREGRNVSMSMGSPYRNIEQFTSQYIWCAIKSTYKNNEWKGRTWKKYFDRCQFSWNSKLLCPTNRRISAVKLKKTMEKFGSLIKTQVNYKQFYFIANVELFVKYFYCHFQPTLAM